jgi:hypothetical protein
MYLYEVCPKSKCTDFSVYDLGTQRSLIYIGELVMTYVHTCSNWIG